MRARCIAGGIAIAVVLTSSACGTDARRLVVETPHTGVTAAAGERARIEEALPDPCSLVNEIEVAEALKGGSVRTAAPRRVTIEPPGPSLVIPALVCDYQVEGSLRGISLRVSADHTEELLERMLPSTTPVAGWEDARWQAAAATMWARSGDHVVSVQLHLEGDPKLDLIAERLVAAAIARL